MVLLTKMLIIYFSDNPTIKIISGFIDHKSLEMLNKVQPMDTTNNQLDRSRTILPIEPSSPDKIRPFSATRMPIDISFKHITYSIEVDKKV